MTQYARLPVEVEATVTGPIEISDGTDILQVNPDGSINVNVISTGPSTPQAIVSVFNTAAAVAPGVETTITTYTVPLGKTAMLERLEFGGGNVAIFNLYINGVLSHRRRIFFGDGLSESMEFTGVTDNGLSLAAGDIVTIRVLQNRPSSADFEARIQVQEIG